MNRLIFLLVCFGVLKMVVAAPFSFNAAQTFLEAKKSKKNIVIDFFGIWCPPCNELDETVFADPIFIEKAKGFLLLKIDADKPESWQLKDKYHVGGYPTVVFTDEKGAELYRIVGYRPLKEFLKVMALVRKSNGRPFEQACKSKDLDDLWRCAIISSERGDKMRAADAFKKLEKKLPQQSSRYAIARSYFVENAESEDLKRDGFERLMKELPESPMALYWVLQYVELFKEGVTLKPKKELLELVLQHFSKAIIDPVKDEAGLTDTDLFQMRAEILTYLGKEEEAKAVWKETAILFDKLTQGLAKGSGARGFTIERIRCLEQAGAVDTALELANQYREKYPGEFTFHFQVASILKRQKKFQKSIPVAELAYKHSYGDNKIRSATLLVELYATQSDKERATRVYKEVIQEIKPKESLNVRTHKYLAQLENEIKSQGILTDAPR